jgi:hypothetical protein
MTPKTLHQVLDHRHSVSFGSVGRASRPCRRLGRLRQLAVARGGHDRGQAQHALRKFRRQHLRDHAAHRGADDVGLRNAKLIHQAAPCRRPCPPACRGCAPAGAARRQPWPAQVAALLSRRAIGEPASRLSKRTTRKPRATSAWQKLSGQAISCMPSPMIRTMAGCDGSPSDSCSMCAESGPSAHSAARVAGLRRGVRHRGRLALLPATTVRRGLRRAGGDQRQVFLEAVAQACAKVLRDRAAARSSGEGNDRACRCSW